MLVLNSEITIGDFTFDFVGEVEVTQSVDQLTQYGTITIPRNIVFKKDNQVVENFVEGVNALFARGDAVTISVGYEPNLTEILTALFRASCRPFRLRLKLRTVCRNSSSLTFRRKT